MYRFKDVKSGTYLLKDLEQRAVLKGKDTECTQKSFLQVRENIKLGRLGKGVAVTHKITNKLYLVK